MFFTKFSRFAVLVLTLSGVLFTSSQFVFAEVAEQTGEPQVRRPAPDSDQFYPVKPEEILPGKIYSHFSQRYHRYVWAYALPDGGFSYPLGPGSTEDPDNFDVTTSKKETRKILESYAGPWAKQSRSEGRKIHVRLGDDNRWTVVRGSSIRTHFDLDSRLRWEWHGKHKAAVLHLYGRRWEYHEDGYRPLISWTGVIQPTCSNCNLSTCAHCSSL